LERLLAARDREMVAGDLREEYAESIVPRRDRLRANLGYLRQVSRTGIELPAEIHFSGKTHEESSVVCIDLHIGLPCWFTLMEMVLLHPGYLPRIGASACIARINQQRSPY